MESHSLLRCAQKRNNIYLEINVWYIFKNINSLTHSELYIDVVVIYFFCDRVHLLTCVMKCEMEELHDAHWTLSTFHHPCKTGARDLAAGATRKPWVKLNSYLFGKIRRKMGRVPAANQARHFIHKILYYLASAHHNNRTVLCQASGFGAVALRSRG